MVDEVMQDTTAEVDGETSVDYDNLFEFTEESEEEAAEETAEAEESEEETEQEKTEEAAEETTEEEETVDFKYFGQTSKLSKTAIEKIGSNMGKSADEIVTLLQKGANYENSPLHRLIDKYAEANGMNREEYVKFLEDTLPGLAESIQRNKVAEEHPDWDDEKVELQAKLNLTRMNAAKTEREEKEKRIAEYEANKPFLEFIAKYPNVKEFPAEVERQIAKGISPIIAYESYIQEKEYNAKMQEINKQIAKEERKAKNKAKSTGSLKENDGDEEEDWFSKGLFDN